MERRKALEKMALSLGYIVAAPTFTGLLQGCANNENSVWIPKLLSQSEGVIFRNIVDVVLPKTDTPSASEVNVHIFLDNFAAACFKKEEQETFKKTINELASIALKNSDSSELKKVSISDLTPVIQNAVMSTSEDRIPFIMKLRGLIIWAYKCNEYVGEEVLAYDPIPGAYYSCESLNEISKGKAWSVG